MPTFMPMGTLSLKKIFPQWVSTEALIMTLLWVLYFIGQAFAKERPHLHYWEVIFAANYFVAILIINYRLLPGFFYKKRYFAFFFWSAVAIVGVTIIQEVILEPIFLSERSQARVSGEGGVHDISEMGPIILLFVGFKLAWDNLKKQALVEELEKQKAESELQFLKSQLNPHFLFNNLNNLYSYSQENSPKTPEIILQLSNIMRYMLYESREKFVPLENELTSLRDFIRLQELQMEDRGKVEFSVTGKANGHMIAPLLLIPFVENSFKHSMSSQADDIAINIRVDIQDRELDFQCTNTYLEDGKNTGKYVARGIGLDNVRKRLELLYAGKHQLEIETADNVYRVKLQLGL